MRKLLFFAALLAFAVSCGNNPDAKKEAAVAEQRTEAETTPSYKLDELLPVADSLVGQEVIVRGFVTHTCKHSGRRCFIVGDSQKTSMRVEAGGKISGFNRELIGAELAIRGILRENRLSREYLAQMEKDLDERMRQEDGSVEACASEQANLAEMKAWMEANGKDHYSVYYLDGVDYEVVEE